MKKNSLVIFKYPFHSHHAKFRGWILHPYIPVAAKVWLVLLLMAVLGAEFFSILLSVVSIILLPFLLLRTESDKGDSVTIYDDRIETIYDGEKETIYWKNIVQRSDHQWDVSHHLERISTQHVKIYIRFDYEKEGNIVDLNQNLFPAKKVVVKFKDLGCLRYMFLRSLIIARPELRVDSVLYDDCETSPVDLSRTKKMNNLYTLVIGGSILIGGIFTCALMPYISPTLSSVLLTMFAMGFLTIGCVCLGVYLMRHHFVDPEDQKVREQRLSHIASYELIQK
jgi:hypothetical protein